MALHYFYYDSIEGKEVPSSEPIVGTVDQILHSMQGVLTAEGNFLGIVDDDENCLQFATQQEYIVIDFPLPKKGGSFSKITTLERCLGIVKHLNDKIVINDYSGLIWKEWLTPPKKPWWKFW